MYGNQSTFFVLINKIWYEYRIVSRKFFTKFVQKAENNYMGFSERLEELLKSKKITQTELAERLNIRRASISEWKRYKTFPYADVAVRIAAILGTTVEELITGELPVGISPTAFKVAQDFDNLDETGQELTVQLVSSLRETHSRGGKSRPLATGGQGA
jgi:transcriptional regulator with XRE-family HTH domain